MDNSILVSVIIPSYGGGDFLKRAINSVLMQSYQNVEVIVVDDNGKGTINQKRTENIIHDYSDNERVSYHCHDFNKNGSAARNTGARTAKGSYLTFLDDDDEYKPNFIEDQLSVINNLSEEYALVYCSFEKLSGDEIIDVVHAKASGKLMYKIMTHKLEIPTTSWIIRKKAFNSVGGFDESFERHQDWEFVARIAYNYKIMANDKVCYKRHVVFRNSPKKYEQARSYRLHYLEKMKPYIAHLTGHQQKNVRVINMLDVSIKHINEIGLKGLFRDYIENKSGIEGVCFLFNRLCNIIKRGKLRIAK